MSATAAACRMHPARAVNIAATISACSGVLSVLVSAFALRISGAPSSGEQRWFSLIALAAGAFSLGNLPLVTGASDPMAEWASRTQLAAALLHVWGWNRFSWEFLSRTPGRLERLASHGLPAAALLALVPGVALGGAILDRPFPALGMVYRLYPATPLGEVMMAATLSAAALVVLRFVRAARAGTRHAGILGAALAVLVAFGVNDALAAAEVLEGPSLLDVGFSLPVLAVGWVLTSRFIESSVSLDRLLKNLEAEVRARTEELSSAHLALHQTERLAALGQFAAGVAHEVNSPAAVVTTNLRYLESAAGRDAFPADAREVLRDALGSMRRINDLVRKLVDAGRIAMVPGALASVSVSEAALKVLSECSRAAPSIAFEADVPGDLQVRARRDALDRVLAALVANAAEAVAEKGAGVVSVRAARSAGSVRVTVSDSGAGMEPEVLRRAFDPFFTTKPHGRGTGLGLPVARGLAEASGGKLTLASTPGEGTTAVLELPDAPPRAD